MTARHQAALVVGLLLAAAPSGAQSPARQSTDRQSPARARIAPVGYGTLRQNDLALRIRNDDIELRFVPIDERVIRLLAPDGYQTLRGLVLSRRHAVDSVASRAGVGRPGIALVSFFARRAGARYDPQTLTLQVRSQVFQPLGIVPLSPRFSTHQLDVREQVSALYLFEEELPVNDSFTLSYAGLISSDWLDKVPTLARERGRVSARAREARLDSAGQTDARE